MTTDPPSGTRPTTFRLRSQASRTRTMAESLDSFTFNPPREQEEEEAGPENNSFFPLYELRLETLLFHFCAGKTLIDAELIVNVRISVVDLQSE